MKALFFILALVCQGLAQTEIENSILTIYTGTGRSPEDAFRPLLADRFPGMGWTDLTSVEGADSVGLLVISATYIPALDAQIKADTSAFVLSKDPAQNNFGQLVAFLARKKNGTRLTNGLRGKPSISIGDIVSELKTIDREKKRKRVR